MTALGIMFRRECPPEQLAGFTRRAEALGFDELWLVEDCFYAGGIAQAATALAHSESLWVGLGIMPAVARNAAFTALEIASLARIAPGRFLPGIGHGVGAWMRQIGAYPRSQLGALEETTTTLRAILRGEAVSVQGDYVRLDAVQLFHPLDADPVPPIQLGVRGPKSLRLSGRVGDGTIMAEGSSPAYIRWARGHIDAGRAEVKRTDAHRITLYVYWSMDEDVMLAKARVREKLAANMASGRKDIYQEAMGIVEDVEALLKQGGQAHLREHMPEAWLHQLAVVGTADECAATIERLSAAGVDSIVLVPLMDNERALNIYAEPVIQQSI